MPKKKLDERQKVEVSQLSDEQALQKEKSYFEEAKNARSSNVEKNWLVNDAFYRGDHNIKYNPVKNSVVFDSSDPLGLYVNLVKSTVRAVRNAVVRQRPEWDVDALPYGELSYDEKSILGGFLASLYEELDMQSLVKKAVKNGLVTGKGWAQYGYENTDDGVGKLWVESYNTFDIYPDPYARSLNDCRYIIKVVRRPLETVKANKKYKNTEKLSASEKTSESPYKEQLDSRREDTGGSKTVLLHELWLKDEDNGKPAVRVITTCNGQLLRNEIAEGITKLPFRYYEPETDSDEMNSEGWVKDLVPLNKAINYNEKNILEYNILMVKGRYIKDKNAKISVVTNENGKIISKTRGAVFEQMPVQPLPSTPFNQINNLRSYINDIGSAPEALRGIAPTGITAARALEDLVANAYNSLSDPIDNVIVFLSGLAEDLLNMLFIFQTTRKQFKFKVDGKEKIYFIVGEGGEVGEQEMIDNGGNVIQLPKNPQVKVSITSGVAYTKSAQEETMMRLYGAGLVDRKTVQESFDLNSEKIEQRLMEQNTQGMISDGQGTGQEGQAPQGNVTDIVPQEVYDQLSDAGRGLVEDFADNGLKFDQAFIDNPELLEQLASGQLQEGVDFHIMEDGTVMLGAEMVGEPMQEAMMG